MRGRLWVPTFAIVLALGTAWGFATRTTFACACACSIGCGNHCNSILYDCGFIEGLEATATCCDQARQATGDTGPCLGD
jgi:hypothetical protein